MSPAELTAIRQDAEQRLPALRRAAVRLWRDRDDSMTLCELMWIVDQIRAAEAVLR